MRKLFEVTENIEVQAEPDTCFRVLADFEKYPLWHTYVKRVHIVEAGPRGLPATVHFVFDLIMKQSLEITQRYEYDSNKNLLTFVAVDGDFEASEGFMQFKKIGSGVTEIRYYLKISPGFFVPLKIINFLIDKVLKSFLIMVKKEVERIEKLR